MKVIIFFSEVEWFRWLDYNCTWCGRNGTCTFKKLQTNLEGKVLANLADAVKMGYIEGFGMRKLCVIRTNQGCRSCGGSR